MVALMRRRHGILAAALAAISLVGAATLQTPTIEGFIAALNSSDASALKTFIAAHFDDGIPVDQRVGRLQGLAKMGAPFKILRSAPATDEKLAAVIEDKSGEKLGLVLMLKGGKIAGVMIDEPSIVDAKPPKDYSGYTSIQDLADKVREGTETVGLGIASQQKGGSIEIGVSGVREFGKPAKVEAGDVWNIGSVTKPMTATVVGLLVQEGVWTWKTTLKELFPDLAMKTGYEAATLEQIVRHRAGIPEDGGFRKVDVDRIVGNAKTPTEIRMNYAKDIFSREPISKPGTSYAYSNAGYALLSLAIERQLKMPFAEAMNVKLFQPLGMSSAGVGSDRVAKVRPMGHVPGPNGAVGMEMRGPLMDMMAGAGNVFCSLEDLVKFCRAHLDGLKGRDGLLKSSTVMELHRASLENEGGQWYAAGWGIRPLPGTALAHGHNGSNGTFFAEIAIFPDQELIVVSAANMGDQPPPSPPLQAVTTIGRKLAPAKAKQR